MRLNSRIDENAVGPRLDNQMADGVHEHGRHPGAPPSRRGTRRSATRTRGAPVLVCSPPTPISVTPRGRQPPVKGPEEAELPHTYADDPISHGLTPLST